MNRLSRPLSSVAWRRYVEQNPGDKVARELLAQSEKYEASVTDEASVLDDDD